VEPLFGEAKEWHGARRFRLRRLEKVNVEVLMVASGQNVKRLLAFGSRGPRRPAQVAVAGSTKSGNIAGDALAASPRSFFNRLSPSTHSGE
jgi:hypothetical protein